MDLAATIVRVKQALDAPRLLSEAAVRQSIVLPILRALGWDDLDPERVTPEYGLGGRYVDYALAAFNDRPSLFIEVKKGSAPVTADAEKQLFEYAYHEGIQFAVLTNGQEWSFFLPASPGSYDERLLYKLDLTQRETGEAVERLSRYLAFERVRSGDALKNAQRDYDDLHKGRIVRDSLPRAWTQLLSEPDEVFVDLIAERTATICGFRPTPDEVIKFLVNRTARPSTGHNTALSLERRRGPQAAVARVPAPAAPTSNPVLPPGIVAEQEGDSTSGRIRYILLGEVQTAQSARGVLRQVVRTLAGRNEGFMERFAAQAPARRRNHVARRAEDVYPGQPQLLKAVIEIVPNWYMGMNVSTQGITRLLEVACRVDGLKFGIDLVVDLPST